jgi:hypothetical protein
VGFHAQLMMWSNAHRGTGQAAGAPERLAVFQPAVAELAQRVADVDLRDFETEDRAAADLHPIAASHVEEATHLVGEILAACGRLGSPGDDELELAIGEPSLPFERAIDAAVEAGHASVRAVEDVAFLVQLELRQRSERLARLGLGAGLLSILGEADSALRRIKKGLGAIDVAIARAERLPPRLDFSSELQTSLVVRATYAKFRRRLLSEGTPAPEQLYARMRAAGTQIAVLVGWDAYPLLRVRDRLQLRDLQQRILTWLLPEQRTDHLAGARLWQDIVAFVEMLALVNRRQELIEHDSALLAELSTLMRDAPAETAIPAPLLERLTALSGLDDDLDAALASVDPRASNVCSILERLCARCGASRASIGGGR